MTDVRKARAVKKVSKATVALAYALWDTENTVRLLHPEDQEHMFERAQRVQEWLKVHKAKVVKTK